MAMTNTEKIILVLLLIAIVLSAGSLAFLSGLTSLSGKVDSLVNKVDSLQQDLAASELFPGERDLYQKAKAEGGLVLYSVADISEVIAYLKAFSLRYPGIATSYYTGTTTAIVNKVLTEFQAGARSVDIITGGSNVARLIPTGALQSYTTVQLDKLIMKDPNYTVLTQYITVMAYNKDLVSSLNLTLPQNWEDIINPRYKGLVCLDDPLSGRSIDEVFAILKNTWNNQTRYENFIRGLKALDVPVFGSSGQEIQLVAAGEYPIGFVIQSLDVYRQMEAGAPVDFVKTMDPLIVKPAWNAIYALAPHPNAAKLYCEWSVSVEAQMISAETGQVPNRAGLASNMTLESIFAARMPINPVMAPTEYWANTSKWVDTYVRPIWNP